jgi:hypothetical protein
VVAGQRRTVKLRAAILAFIFLGLLASVVPAQADKTPRMPAISSRRQQEYEALGYDPKKVFVAFDRCKRAFARKDFDAFARLVTYPLTINRKGGPITIPDGAALASYKDQIFAPRHVALVKAQSFQSLSLKDEGAMVGTLMMISGTCTDGGDKPCEYGVTVVNLP